LEEKFQFEFEHTFFSPKLQEFLDSYMGIEDPMPVTMKITVFLMTPYSPVAS